MDRFTYRLVSVMLLLTSILWIIYTLISSFGTECFSFFDAYATIIILLLDLIWGNFIKIKAVP